MLKEVLKPASCLLLAVALSACAGGSTSGQELGLTETEAPSKKEDSKEVIEIDPPYVAVDDENVKVEFTSVSSEIRNAGLDDEGPEYTITYVVTNKTDSDKALVRSWNGGTYIGDNGVDFFDGSSQLLPGKTGEFNFSTYEDAGLKGFEHISSTEDLLNLNGVLEVTLFPENEDGWDD